jgi:predicted Zn-ribbon and HTH transcriptional regulator
MGPPATKELGMAYKCKRCGHEWEGRTKGKPKACPSCKSFQWDQPRKFERTDKGAK